jgi:pimeloyl-ACP methyl ester carboxylesterase
LRKTFAGFSAAISLVLVLCVGLTACTGQPISGPIEGPQPTADAQVAAELREFYTQEISWSSCGGEDTYCADVLVPADWSKPAGERLKIAVAYHKASASPALGSVIFNPGGPGSSGVDWITNSIDQLATKELRAKFNMVGFDPRGVGQSEPRVTCLNAKDTDYFLYGDAGYELGSEKDVSDTRARIKKFTEACVANTGPNLKFIDTVSAAKDLDVIRAVFGDAKINYLGFSYGTQLGATYAALFTDRVGRMVLDGAIDPTVEDSEQNVSQLKGFDLALNNYLASCVESKDCPFAGTVAAAQNKISKLLRSIELRALPTESERELTIWGAVTGIIMPLYSSSWWPALNQGFEEALNGDGTTLLALADTYNDRNEDGSYATNLMEANIAISCLDSRQPADQASIEIQNQKVLAASPILGRYWQFGALTCEQWPYPVVDHPASYAASGSAPILVVGTTGDPATPYSQAVSLANDVLENGRLITFNGEGHTAYGQDNACVNKAVDSYFIKNVVPSEDPNCG